MFLREPSSLRPFVVILLLLPTTRTRADYNQVTAPRTWSFPRDHGRHDGYKTEWWYFTGNVRDAATGRRFGYQLTFFRTAMTPCPTTRPSPWAMTDLYFAHAAITDPSGHRFLYKDKLQRGRPGLAESSDRTMDVFILDWLAQRNDADRSMHLVAKEDAFALDLTCNDGHGPVLEGPGGVNPKGLHPGQASYYYSMTRLPTHGSVTLAGQTFTVDGFSWMDHEFSSNALSKDQVGWDWMGLHLATGDDLMLYRLRNRAGGTDYLSGTRITPDGQPHYLSAGDIQLVPSDPWKSPTTGGSYPQTWSLQIRNLPPLTLRSAMPGQELVTSGSTNVSYFEGAADLTTPDGKPAGEGYLEMTGYAKPLTDEGDQTGAGKK